MNEFIEKQISKEFETKNAKGKNGWSIGGPGNRLSMMGGILAETLVTPKYKDGYLFGGFSLMIEVIEREKR